MLGAAHDGSRVEGQDTAGRESVEHHANGGEVLFHGRGGMAMAEILDVGGDVDRPHRRNRGHAVGLQPGGKTHRPPARRHGGCAGYGSGR